LSRAVTAPCFAPNGNLLVCTGSGEITEFVDNDKGLPQAKQHLQIDGQPNCVSFEGDSEMIICDPSSLALLSASKNQQTMVLCDEYESESFRGPSHCVVAPNGCKYFTDSGPLGDTSLQQPKGSVFMINNQGILRPLAYKCLAQPTDLVFASRQKCLYVLEMLKNRILRFVETNSGAFISSVFYRFNGAVGPTGIDIDGEGNLFVSRFEHKGLNTPGYITVIAPTGKLVGEIASAAPELTGICFNQKTNQIYVTETSTNSIFQIHVDDIFQGQAEDKHKNKTVRQTL